MRKLLLALALCVFGVPVFGGVPVGTTAPAQYGQAGLNLLIGHPPYYVTNFGARCDIASISGLSITGGTNVLSSSSHTFTQADVGKLINIQAAGAYTIAGNTHSNPMIDGLPSTPARHVGDPVSGSGIPVGALVSQIQSTSSILISASAFSSVTGGNITFSPATTFTISSVSGGNAILSGNVLATVTNGAGTWGTDDSVAIQAAETAAANAGGGTLVLPHGRCGISTGINFAGEVSMYGQGYGPGQSSLVWISTTDQTAAMIKGNPVGLTTCSAAVAATWADNQFHDFEIDDSLARQDAGYVIEGKGISMACTLRASAYRLFVHDTPATAIAFDLGFNNDASFNIIYNSGRLLTGGGGSGGNGIGSETHNIATPGISYNAIGNEIHCSRSYAILFGNTLVPIATDTLPIVIADNIIYGCPNSDNSSSGGGISVGNTGAAITGNVVQGDGLGSGFWQAIAVGPSDITNEASGTETVITGNSVTLSHIGISYRYDTYTQLPTTLPAAPIICNNRVSFGKFGILLDASASFTMNVLKICNNTIHHNTFPGIEFLGAGGFSSVDIDGNQLWDNGSAATGAAQAGIYIDGPIANLNVRNNTAFDDGAGTQKFGLSVDTGIAVTAQNIYGNDFARNVTGTIDLVGTLTASGVVNLFPNVLTSKLTPCGAGTLNWLGSVSDATAPTYLGTLTGGSTVGVNVRCNGTNWLTE